MLEVLRVKMNKNGRVLTLEDQFDNVQFIFVHIYARNDLAQQVKCFDSLKSGLVKYAIENVVGGDVNYCALQATEQRGGCRVVLRKREYSCKLFVVSEEFSTQRMLSDTYTQMNNF